MFELNELVITPKGKARIVVLDSVNKCVRVKHLEARTAITDFYTKDLKKAQDE